MLSTACLIERTCVTAPTCFLSPRTHWPSASSRAADTKLPCVIDKCIWVGEASHMGAEVHLLFCLLVHQHLGHGIVCVFVHFFVLCYIGDAAWPCQQDKTAVVKQSQHTVPWQQQCPCGLIYKQDFSSLRWPFSSRLRKPSLLCPIRNWTKMRKKEHLNWMLNLHIQEAVFRSSPSSEQEKPLNGAAWHFLTQ